MSARPVTRRKCRPSRSSSASAARRDFALAYEEAQLQETLAGKIVLRVGGYPHHDGGRVREMIYGPPEVKPMLDNLHLRKIELADEVLILNVAGYIGESTRRELQHARRLGKRIRFLEPQIKEP